MIIRIIGVIFTMIGVWEFYSVRKTIETVRQTKGAATTGWMPRALWGGMSFGIIIVIVGIAMII
ncbi:hypothetical protein LB941_04950 [Ligilactobacillus sp. WILCCON 0076]|uniref:Immunity protein n=1 Tax=Ligilactobacillus ubinensis TaxID=2876789 RepID=A0A9X2FIX4_9LACO|nr:hypothetical protein [Ligilactobacillus ubinensis]MCP0886684.1 hypothetical protein [Ligilactobacillus ubinensis]